jgi:hypothetical protein
MEKETQLACRLEAILSRAGGFALQGRCASWRNTNRLSFCLDSTAHSDQNFILMIDNVISPIVPGLYFNHLRIYSSDL